MTQTWTIIFPFSTVILINAHDPSTSVNLSYVNCMPIIGTAFPIIKHNRHLVAIGI